MTGDLLPSGDVVAAAIALAVIAALGAVGLAIVVGGARHEPPKPGEETCRICEGMGALPPDAAGSPFVGPKRCPHCGGRGVL